MDGRPLAVNQLVLPRERGLFVTMVVVSLLIYGGLGVRAFSDAASGGVILMYGVLLSVGAFLVHALALGRVRGNGILVSERQFADLHRLVAAHARRLGLPNVPTVYVLESGGVINAFATKLLGRTFIIINADVLSLAIRRGPAAVSFVVGHELGHHWRGHLKWRWLIAPARMVPYLGSAYSRACEYSCDRVGAFCEPVGAVDGLLVLAAGGWLHTHVDPREFARQSKSDEGFWIRRAEWMSTHPRLPKRVAALLDLGLAAPVSEALGLTNPVPALQGYGSPDPQAVAV